MPEDPLAPQTPPPQPPTAFDTPTVTGPTSTGMAPNVAAGVAVLFTFVSGIIFLVIEKRSQYVRFWAMQATIYGLVWIAVRILFAILVSMFTVSLDNLGTFRLLGNLWSLFNLAYLVGLIIMLYFAFTGKEWELPVLGKFARQQLVKFPPKP